MDETVTSSGRWLIDFYREWAEGEGVPIIDDFAVDLSSVNVKPWDRLGIEGAIINLKGRGEFLDLWLLEIPPAGVSNPIHHLFEGIGYVISGRGVTKLNAPTGESTFEWGPKAMFAIPINSEYTFYNSSGTEPARLAVVTSCPALMNLFYDEEFVFGSDHRFANRVISSEFVKDGRYTPGMLAGQLQHIWETDFVPDLGQFAELRENEARGKGARTIMFSLGDGTMHAHMSEVPGGAYKKGHRHPAGLHIFPIGGRGYSLFWNEGETEFRKIDWKDGICYAPPGNMFHQHFNLNSEPARYIALGLGSRRHPFSRQEFLTSTSEQRLEAKYQIEYEDEDPRIAVLFQEELARLTGDRSNVV